ncbi:DUF1273 domain-containing protein [Heyndrickxia vini]|uniref:UPF0398 protein I5776_09335 n=1 Tax=Heyndrickxia vini TaxID=1476025 RepID=A0ABX7E844_9BACI|nr:DUF1273 domain-containing protein [Heyndrickxia vini]QQZ11488.1 DUF1273 domain-containing protein [Heyndrickxia vini]
MKVISISGYKPFELGIFSSKHPAIEIIKKAIKKELIRLIEEGLEWVLISGQLGVELWAAEVIFELQDVYPTIKLAILTPFENQEGNWNESNKEFYEMILSQADFVDSISKQPYTNPQQFRNRNRIFLHKSQAMLIVYDAQNEGSPKYMYEEAKKYKEQNNFEIISIDFDQLQMLIEDDEWDTY